MSVTSNFGAKPCFLSSLRISRSLDKQVEDLALVIDGPPEVHPLPGDPHHHLVQVPSVARPRAPLAQPSRDRGTEFQHPAPHRFVGDVEPALGQQFLDIAVAQGEAEIEPDRVLDDLGWEAMTAVAERSHADIPPLAARRYGRHRRLHWNTGTQPQR